MPRPLTLVAGLVLLAVTPLLAGCGSKPKPPPPDLADPSLEMARVLDVLWEWEATVTPEEERMVSEPSLYTIRFEPGNRMFIRADCNRGGANYELDGNERTISLTPGMMTRAACPPESKDFVFMNELNDVGRWRFEGGMLLLELRHAEAWMRFRPAPPEG
jgi:heat shock protein HslJ